MMMGLLHTISEQPVPDSRKSSFAAPSLFNPTIWDEFYVSAEWGWTRMIPQTDGTIQNGINAG